MKKVDVIIIGAGPAGLSAAIYLKRYNISFVLLSFNVGGQVLDSGEIENYLGINGIAGFELSKKFFHHIHYFNIFIQKEKVININKKKENFFVHCESGNVYCSLSVLICIGCSYKKLNVEGEKEFKNKGLSYCTTCDGFFFKNQKVCIIGGGNSALDSALLMSRLTQQIIIINKNSIFKGEKMLLEKVKEKKIKIIYNALTKGFFGKKKIEKICYIDLLSNVKQFLNIDGVFVKIGMFVNSNFLFNFSHILNKYKEIEINHLNYTKEMGIFAAGDCTNIIYKQISIAVGEGAKAALSINNFLKRYKNKI